MKINKTKQHTPNRIAKTKLKKAAASAVVRVKWEEPNARAGERESERESESEWTRVEKNQLDEWNKKKNHSRYCKYEHIFAKSMNNQMGRKKNASAKNNNKNGINNKNPAFCEYTEINLPAIVYARSGDGGGLEREI